jgi:hypothetical protein
MEENNFDKKLEELKKPSAALPEHQRRLRFTYVNAKKSAWWGILLILFPIAIMFISFGISFPPESRFGLFFSAIRKMDILGIPLAVLVFLGGVLSALALNLLSIIHISLENNPSEIGFMVVVKKKYWNIFIILAIIVIVGFMMINLLAFQRSG